MATEDQPLAVAGQGLSYQGDKDNGWSLRRLIGIYLTTVTYHFRQTGVMCYLDEVCPSDESSPFSLFSSPLPSTYSVSEISVRTRDLMLHKPVTADHNSYK